MPTIATMKLLRSWGTRHLGGRRSVPSAFFVHFVFDFQVAAHVAEGFFLEGEFTEVVLPGVCAPASADVALALDC